MAAIWMDITSEVQQGLPKSVLVQYGGQGCLNHPILGERLRAVTMALLTHTDMDVVDILGEVDAMKVCSCMTLFDVVSPDDVFQEVLDGFYKGKYDLKTLNYM